MKFIESLSAGMRAPFTDKLWRAKGKFRKSRADFYYDLAESMENEPGTRITLFIERYADRYPKEPVGKLAAHWLEVYREEGSFTEALRGTVPSEDIGNLLIAEQSGDLKVGLRSLSSVIAGLDSTLDAIRAVFLSTIFVFLAAQFYVGFYSFKIVPTIERSIPPEIHISDLGLAAIVLHWLSFLVRHLWPLWFAGIGFTLALVLWSVPNYVGKYRGFLDRHVLHFQLYREFHSASFLTSLGAVTQRINNKVLPIPKALQLMEPDAAKWTQSHIRRILVNLEENPEGKGENFNTGLVKKETHYRMIDIAQYANMSDMLDRVGKGVLKRTPKEMEKRAEKISFASRIVLVAVVMGLSWGFNAMSWSFQRAVTNNTYAR
jgi:type II secretory pathway component PulF